MTYHVDNFFKRWRAHPRFSVILILSLVGFSLLSAMGILFGIVGEIHTLRSNDAPPKNTILLRKLEYGGVEELSRLAERLVAKSNVASFPWGEFLFDAQYYGWSQISNGIAFSGRVENMKSPIKEMPGDWKIKLLLNGKELETEISWQCPKVCDG